MNISTTSATSPGSYAITINGTGGGKTHSATYILTVNQQPAQCSRVNPIVSITPSSQSGLAGSNLTYTVTVANGDSGTDCTRQVFILTSSCSSGWTCSFALPTLSIAPGATNTTTINVTSPSTASGSNSFTVIANSGSYINAASATYVVSTACSRDNPDIIINPSDISKQAGENQTFTITVTNNDSSSCDKSTFNLTTDCLQGWQCTLNPNSLLISPGSSNSSNLTIKSASTAALGQYLINLTVANRADTKYNATKSIGFIVISKCDGAGIKITDAYLYENSAKITVENNGTAGNLTITSANITDKFGKIYKADNLPITNFDVKETEYITFSKAPDCTNVSKVTVTTNCPKASASSADVRCLTTPPTAIVEIVNVTHKAGTVNATLKNIGTEAIDSGLITILLDGVVVKCKQTFTLAPKSSRECDIPDFECSGTAKLEITEPNENETEFECEKVITITVQSCKDADCNQPLETFVKGEEVYFNVETDPADASVTAVIHNGGTETIDLTEPFKPEGVGSYTIELTASKEGYSETTSEVSFVVEAKSGVSPKIIIVVLIILGLAGFMYYILKKTSKTKSYEKLYAKYGKKETYEDLYRKYGRNRRYRRRR
jgi:archaellum component FlaF (FlaF/FlaG flagellin family)